MKRLFPLLLLVILLFCACGSQIPSETITPTEQTAFILPEPTGFYAPGSTLETATLGALRTYPLDRNDSYGLVNMGDDLLLFSGYGPTLLTKLSGENLSVTAETQLSDMITPDDPSVQVSRKGVTYYDRQRCEIVFLDGSLREVSRTPLPDGTIGAPALSADRKTLYYCTDSALYALDLDAGLNRLLRQMHYPFQELIGIHCGDSVLACSVTDEYGTASTLYISVDDGSTLSQTPPDTALFTYEGSYLAFSNDGEYRQILTGLRGVEPQELCTASCDTNVYPLLPFHTVLADADADGITLSLCDLRSGLCTAAVRLPGTDYYPEYFLPSLDGTYIYFLCYGTEFGCDAIVRWSPADTAFDSGISYLAPRRTAESPDEAGLDECTARAAGISEKYGIRLLIWRDAAAAVPEDYIFEPEYQVPLIERSLDTLEAALSRYPDGMLKKAAAGTDSKKITVCLVRSITGRQNAPLPGSNAGLQFWSKDGGAFVAVTPGYAMEGTLYHELYHVIDNRVLTLCSAFDSWSKLNPPDFTYDFDYAANALRTDDRYTFGDGQAFIDLYSMSFPREDRARIMEYAMQDNNEFYFTSEIMQQKLRQLCLGIREAFGLRKSEAVFPWEQYLDDPITAK